jgi:hypothetical protein
MSESEVSTFQLDILRVLEMDYVMSGDDVADLVLAVGEIMTARMNW